ncbi:uncharacterized protein ACA1_247530 [Acanthamoeba castellanii str. Neff]|uniref:Uncharacterized protein n=1 Tax=Acanthamoeba castellanii (strain ATCC 30010 / Neff) TaxID=1257118 RepID=L8GKH7_ACACF|nr:uncharacterized protein ACA1_247530 [Acanthamoeba castellanii str. Neff]ELR13527.1 hypothetical protein ACA1_247530 [Acanthamoeba castellanii str. Neff]
MVPVVETIDRIEGIVTSIKEIVEHGSDVSNVSAVRAAGELKAVTRKLKAVAERHNDAPQAADATAPVLANLQRDVAVAVEMLRNIKAPAPAPTVIHDDSGSGAIVEAIERQHKQVQDEIRELKTTQQDEFKKQVAQIETALKNVNPSGRVIHMSDEVTFKRAIEHITHETKTQLAKINQSLKASTISNALHHQLMAIHGDIQALIVPATTANLQATIRSLKIRLKGINQRIKALADTPHAPNNTKQITDMVHNAKTHITTTISNIQIASTATPVPAVQHVTQQQDPAIINQINNVMNGVTAIKTVVDPIQNHLNDIMAKVQESQITTSHKIQQIQIKAINH